MLVFGEAKVGKSFAALQLACCLTSGVEWLGFPVPKATNVVYVQLDTPRSLWAERIEDLRDSGHPVEGVHFADLESLNTYPFNILKVEHNQLLKEALEPIKPGAVIIDTLKECHQLGENEATEMQKVISELNAAVQPAALILVTHSKKINLSDPTQRPSLRNDPRGSTYVVGKMDGIVRFWPNTMQYVSRVMEEGSTKLVREDDGTWSLDKSEVIAPLVDRIASENVGLSQRELAEILSQRLPSKNAKAWRSYLQRRNKRLGKARLVKTAQPLPEESVSSPEPVAPGP